MTSSGDNLDKPSSKSAQRVLELFYDRYSVDKVKVLLLESFQGYALNDKKGFLKLGIGEQEVGEVFDGLIGLVVAVRVLMEEGKVEGVRV